jgi:hypothetical protein
MFWWHGPLTSRRMVFRQRWSLHWGRMGWRWRSVDPALSLWVPGPANIMLIPVAGNTVGQDADADHGAGADDRNIRTLIRVNNVAGVDPTPARPHLHIAPAIVGHAALNGDRHTGQQNGNYRVFHPWPSAQIHLFGGIGQLSL